MSLLVLLVFMFIDLDLIDFTLYLCGLVDQSAWVFVLISCMFNVFEYNCDIMKQYEAQHVHLY